MAGVEDTEFYTAVSQEEQQQHPFIAYRPLPRGDFKEEPLSEEDQDESNEEMQHLIAYRPLPHGKIKEELEVTEERDEFISNEEQV